MSFLEFYKFYWAAPQNKREELCSEIAAIVDEDVFETDMGEELLGHDLKDLTIDF